VTRKLISNVWREQADLIELVRDLGARVLSVDIEERFERGEPNPAAVDAMRDAGLYRLTLPRRWGGLGRDYAALAAVCEELGAIDVAYQINLTVHLALTAMTILQWGSEAQQRAWLPQLVSGERIGTFGLTEPGAGSDVGALRMRARPVAGGYLLNGEKTWISVANQAGLFLLFATSDRSARHRGISAFIVPRETPGLQTVELRGKLGARAGDTGSVFCDDVFVPNEQVLGEPGEGFAVALSALGNGLFTVGCGALGIAAETRRIAADLLRSCKIPASDLAAAELAWMVAREETARLLVAHAAQLKNRAVLNGRETGLAKWMAAEAGYHNADAALLIHQTLVAPEAPTLARHLANARGAVIYGGTAEIHQGMQGSYALGYRHDRAFRKPSLSAEQLAL
jgi:glutaryl-CoA dehydrogenase (non-decarboxylating)